MLSSTTIDYGSSRSTSGGWPIVFVNSDVHSYRFCSLYSTRPSRKQRAKVRTDHANQRNTGLKAGNFCPEFEQFKHVLSPEFTGFENREPLLGRVLNHPIVEVLNIHAKLLTIEAKKCSTFAQITRKRSKHSSILFLYRAAYQNRRSWSHMRSPSFASLSSRTSSESNLLLCDHTGWCTNPSIDHEKGRE